MPIRSVTGRAPVLREVRAAAPLMGRLAAPVPARAPWLTAAVHTARRWSRRRPVAVLVDQVAGGPRRAGPDGLALVTLRRTGPVTVVGLLGQDAGPLPAGRPPARLLARDDDVAAQLAGGLLDLLDSLRGPWRLCFRGLPLGDPTVRHLAARLDTAAHSTSRSARLVDELDTVGPVTRSTDPARLELVLPAVLSRVADPAARVFLPAAARLHVAIGQLEVAVVGDPARPDAVLLTLLDGDDRWPWWGTSDVGGLRTERGAPVVGLDARSGLFVSARR
ncbi:hypothetical protein GB931_18090 [Modestobacter sp. I12A-02628]|uniref:Uncharacterized protein n=1 Tax=Goekera deserti TaxID=2497753 RepID=A0A7K3WAM7_9ACTN|nr:hypothetical protein [Goekera deserti]MPQ99792.1 hypothetical protein [Goekera deserti]NDI49949.1 hypothetical protein [Goekera deserti]NEL52573.1 hypothetical protein [Goekera deserti]